MKVQPGDLRVQKCLTRHLKSPAYRWDDLTDPRDPRGVRRPLAQLLDALLLGLLSGACSLREVEAITEELGAFARQYVPERIPDTTLWDLIPRLFAEELREKLVQQVRAAHRSKALRFEHLPCGVVAIDGKGLGALEHDADGAAQKARRSHDHSPYWLSRVLRAVLVSAEARPCIDQMPVPAKTNEMGTFAAFFRGLNEAYGGSDLFEIITADAGFTSRENAQLVHEADKGYIFALKETQPELLREAKRLLSHRDDADAETDWEIYQGKRVRRRLYRTTEMAGYHDWDHLRQVWRVVQETWDPVHETLRREERYFLTNVPTGRLTPSQILGLVRRHWAIENDCFWTLDVMWREDKAPFCTRGDAAFVLAWLRLMAYNLLQQARRRHLRRKRPDGHRDSPSPWRRLFAWVVAALRHPLVDPQESPACG